MCRLSGQEQVVVLMNFIQGKKKNVAASKELLEDGAGRTSFLFVVTFSFRGDLGSEIRCGVNDVLQSDCRLGSSKRSSV